MQEANFNFSGWFLNIQAAHPWLNANNMIVEVYYSSRTNLVYSEQMTFWATSLRITLSLGLILNGSSLAMAVTGADMGIEGGSHTVAKVGGGMEHPCHGVESAGASDSADSKITTDPSKSRSPDCCKSGVCGCACLHAAAPIPTIAMLGVTIFHGPVLRPLESRHASPVLPEQIRPPIS